MAHPSDQQPFGKLEFDEAGGIENWHPLTDHLTDVAACFERLCGCLSIRRSLERVAGRPLTSRDIARLAVLVFLHDLGKANSGFQAKRWRAPTAPPKDWPGHAGHGIEAVRLFSDDHLGHLLTRLPLEPMTQWIPDEAGFSLLIATLSHHGRPLLDQAAGPRPAIWRLVPGSYDPAAVLESIGNAAQALYPEAFRPGGAPLPDSPAFSHLFAGLVQLADWLGSSHDFFPFSREGEERAATAPALADAAVRAVGLDMEGWRARLLAVAPDFAKTFDVPAARPMQAAMTDPDLGPLVILEAETGSGKTEAALWRYLHLYRTGRVDGLYFALPTRVAATQLYDRLRSMVERTWPVNPPLAVRALSGYVSADGADARLLPRFEVQWSDRPDDVEAHRRWAAESPKRFLAAPLAVGTIDQALLGVLPLRHAHLRLASLARSLLVVDEVHASDAYMGVLLEHLLKAHLAHGGHALLLSATLGAAARRRYLSLLDPGAGPRGPLGFEAACAVPYPALSEKRVEATGTRKPVRWQVINRIDEPERIATLAIEAAAQGAKVLVIRNTVPAAVATFAAIEAQAPDPAWLFQVNGVATLHHSRFSRQDRPLMDRAVEACLGYGRPPGLGNRRPPGPLILVGTQTLEQSLDLDADLLITDLCPMDVLLQRIGRLHRHAHAHIHTRPAAFQDAQVWVLGPAGGDLHPFLAHTRHGLGRFPQGGGVYPDLRILEATRRLIGERPEVVIPDENRYLVEAATHPERLDAIQCELGPEWGRHGQQIEGELSAERTVGNLHAIDRSRHFGEEAFPQDERIGTRLGTQDRILRFDGDPIGPFGEPLRELPVRYYLLPKGVSPDAQPEGVEPAHGEITFRLGKTGYRYGRLGLERLREA